MSASSTAGPGSGPLDDDGGGELTSRLAAHIFYSAWSTWMTIANLAAMVVAGKLLRSAPRVKGTQERSGFPTNLIILNMAICDFVTGISGVAFQVVSGGDFATVSRSGCVLQAYLLSTFAVQSVFLVLVLGFTRYRILALNPLTLQQVKMILISTWFSSVPHGVFVAATGVADYGPGRVYCYHQVGRYNTITTLLTAMAASIALTPALLLMFYYTRAFRNVTALEANAGASSKRSRRIAQMGFSVVLVYAVTVLPWAYYVFYRLIVPPENEVSPDTDATISVFLFLNFGINPVLYFAFQKSYTNVLRRWMMRLGCRWGEIFSTKDSTSLPTATISIAPTLPRSSDSSDQCNGQKLGRTTLPRSYDSSDQGVEYQLARTTLPRPSDSSDQGLEHQLARATLPRSFDSSDQGIEHQLARATLPRSFDSSDEGLEQQLARATYTPRSIDSADQFDGQKLARSV